MTKKSKNRVFAGLDINGNPIFLPRKVKSRTDPPVPDIDEFPPVGVEGSLLKYHL